MKIKVFRAEDINQALSMMEAVEVVKNAFVQLSSKQAQSPVRTSLNLRNQGEVALTMPAFLGETLALGTKIVTVLPQNPSRGLSAVQALVVLFDATTGGPSAILEGTHLTRLRTGAATGAATQVFSRRDAKKLALFGAGGQAFFQVQGVWAARKEEAGDLIIPLKKGLLRQADIQAELGEVIAGKKPGRRDDQEITYFKSVGNAVQDISVAQAVFQRAVAKGLGQEVEL